MPGPYGLPQMGYGREGQGRAAARPFRSWRVVARKRVVTYSPSESPSHLTVTAPFDKGAFASPPLRGFGGTPEFTIGGRLGGVKNGQ